MTEASQKIPDSPQIIDSYDQLLDMLKTDELNQGFELSYLDHIEDHVVLCKNQLKLYFISGAFLTRPESSGHLEKISEDPFHFIVCADKVELISEHEGKFVSDNIHKLQLPTVIEHCSHSIESFHKIQTMLHLANADHLQTAQNSEEVKYILSISRELNGERNLPKLLNLILKKVRNITKADAGSIYTIDDHDNEQSPQRKLRFRFTQNDSIIQNLSEFELPINDKSVVGNAVIHSQKISIPDLYQLSDNPKENPFGVTHDRSWDKRTGYESHSMLTIPMFDISHSVIGVIQLINSKKDPNQKLTTSKDFQEQVVPFHDKLVEYAEIVAQQAGIALENAKMQDDIQKLFDGFVNASVTAIELRDPTTSGHSHRVAKLTLELARVVDRSDAQAFRGISFNKDQLKEIEYASLLHDFGKLGVQEKVLLKAKKLYPDELRLIEERFRLIRASYEIEYLKNCMKFQEHPEYFPMGMSLTSFKIDFDNKCRDLEKYFEFICKANEPSILEQGGFEILRDIANLSFSDTYEKDRPFLSPGELKSLSVSRGSLTAEEFAQIQSHVTHTYEFLRKIPWGPKLHNVPQIAAKHHEKLDGSGYPTSAASRDIPIQSRMMTVADIFDALTAADRPYKKAVPLTKALDIIEMEVKGGKLDHDVFQLFLDAEIFKILNN